MVSLVIMISEGHSLRHSTSVTSISTLAFFLDKSNVASFGAFLPLRVPVRTTGELDLIAFNFSWTTEVPPEEAWAVEMTWTLNDKSRSKRGTMKFFLFKLTRA